MYEYGTKVHLRKIGDIRATETFKISLFIVSYFSLFLFISKNAGHLSLKSIFSHFR